MIQIKPVIEHHSPCPYCGQRLTVKDVLWQGIHVCAVSRCDGCAAEIIEDLPVGQALYLPYRVDVQNNRVFGSEAAMGWLGLPLLQSLKAPRSDREIKITIERCAHAADVVILNCIDYLYGHSLLKLLTAQTHLEESAGPALIVIVPGFLRWMVPDGVTEIWSVDIPLAEAQDYHPQLDMLIKKECERFGSVYISPAFSHPKDFNITRFTRVAPHDFTGDGFRITFIWREDRLWWNGRFWFRLARATGCMKPLLWWQNVQVRRLFSRLRKGFPDAVFTVAGLGRSTGFPSWMDDRRVERFTDEEERRLCAVYAESRLVMGVHGSSMLLPSAHAGMTLDLMPADRWSNFAQDVLYQEDDPRLASYRYRYLPINTEVNLLARIAALQIEWYAYFKRQMMNERN